MLSNSRGSNPMRRSVSRIKRRLSAKGEDMFLKLPQKLYNELVRVANAEGKSAASYVVESVQKRIEELSTDKK